MLTVMTFWPAVVMNLLVPGTGLIALGRMWLGIALAVWFALGAEMAIGGLMLAPMSLPAWVALTAGGLAVTAWLVGQGLLVTQIRFLRDPNLPAELQALRELAEDALNRGDLVAAKSSLRVALLIDEADLASRVLWARLLTRQGRRAKARRAWHQAQRLDQKQIFEAEIRQAMEEF